jgi:hypothetical protein
LCRATCSTKIMVSLIVVCTSMALSLPEACAIRLSMMRGRGLPCTHSCVTSAASPDFSQEVGASGL